MLQTSFSAIGQDIATVANLDWTLETLFNMSVYEAEAKPYTPASTCCSALIRINKQQAYLLIINCADNALQAIYEKSCCFDEYGLGLDGATDTLQFLVNYMAKRLGSLLEIQEPQYSPAFPEAQADGIMIDKYYEYKGESIHLIMAEMMGVMDPT